MKKLLFILACCITPAVGNATPSNPTYGTVTLQNSGSTGNISGMTSLAPGTSSARSLANRASDFINVRDYGALGNGTTDDAPDINNAIAAARAATLAGDSAEVMFPPGGTYLITEPLNFTDFSKYYGAKFDFNSSTILCETGAGSQCIDATGSTNVKFDSLKLRTLSSGSTLPAIGIHFGRQNTVYGCSEDSLYHTFVMGYFTFTAVYNFGCENFYSQDAHIQNSETAGTTYELVNDSSNSWGVTSLYAPVTDAANTAVGMDENTWDHPVFQNPGSEPVIWSLGSRSFFINNGYELQSTATVAPFDFVDNGTSSENTNVHLQLHSESAPPNDFQFSGSNPTPTVFGLWYTNRNDQATASVFSLGAGLTNVTLQDLHVHDATMTASVPLFDNPAAYTVSGDVYVPAAANWNMPSTFWGCVTEGVANKTCYQTIPVGTGLVSTNGVISASYPNPMPINGVAASSYIASITPSTSAGAGGFHASFAASGFPAVAISAPSAPGGTQAAAVIASAQLTGIALGASGTGGTCAVNSIITTMGGTFSTAFSVKVTATDGSGDPTAVSIYNTGVYSVLPQGNILAAAGQCAGAGFYLSQANYFWIPDAITVTAPGSGYTAGVTATYLVQTGTVSTTISLGPSTFTATGGNGELILNASGTELGINGSAGYPVISAGALIDGSGVRVALTTAGYTVPRNTSLVRFTQTSAIASATIILPTALADGQPIQFVNYAGAVTALTFSPAVNGWTNGSTLAAYTGVRIRWDATAGAWFREQ